LHIPVPKRLRGSKGAGLAFERALAHALPQARHGQWFKFVDENGAGHCCPDLLLIGSKKIAVIECKLSNVEEGRAQIADLYLPILSFHYNRPVLGVVACRHLGPESVRDPVGVFASFKDALAASDGEAIPVFHWLGRGKV
jgi:hypothetical protein